MLYVSSKNNKLTYTAYQALTMSAAADGGIIIPMRLPHYDKIAIMGFSDLDFGCIAADVLQKFFSVRENRTDIINYFNEAVPNYTALDRKTLLVRFGSETISRIEEKIFTFLSSSELEVPAIVRCAVRISLLWGLYVLLKKLGIYRIDIAVSSINLYDYLPAVFSKEMGIPFNSIICGANSEEGLWNYMRRDSSAENEETDIFTSVVSDNRANEIISHKQNMSIFAAYAYGALQDYRSITGENVTTIIIN